MNELARVLIVGLAAWRLASLLAYEMGPFDVLERVRRRAGVPESGPVEGVLAQLITCPWCLTIWTAPLMWIAWSVAWWLPGIVAAAAVAITVEGWNREHR